jgi:hypothetical protein
MPRWQCFGSGDWTITNPLGRRQGWHLDQYRKDIKDLAEARGISRLYHFTRAENARSILTHGLVSRDILVANGVEFLASDAMRADGRLDALSLSIHWINRAMFDLKKRVLGGEWLILEIDASVLWTHACRFCWENAARSEMSRYKDRHLREAWAFDRMFDDRPVNLADTRSYRDVFLRPDNRPTDEAAEVQVLTPIDRDLIIDVTVRNQVAKDWLSAVMQEVGHVRPIAIYADIFR